jgi:hypothetical protein
VIFREVSAPKLPNEGGRVPPRSAIACIAILVTRNAPPTNPHPIPFQGLTVPHGSFTKVPADASLHQFCKSG